MNVVRVEITLKISHIVLKLIRRTGKSQTKPKTTISQESRKQINSKFQKQFVFFSRKSFGFSQDHTQEMNDAFGKQACISQFCLKLIRRVYGALKKTYQILTLA